MEKTPAEASIITTLVELRTTVGHLAKTVDALKTTVAAQEKRLHLVYTAVVVVVSAVGGPNAIQALTGH